MRQLEVPLNDGGAATCCREPSTSYGGMVSTDSTEHCAERRELGGGVPGSGYGVSAKVDGMTERCDSAVPGRRRRLAGVIARVALGRRLWLRLRSVKV